MTNITKKVDATRRLDIDYFIAIPFILFHLSIFMVFWTGITATAVIIGLGFFVMRIWACTAGYHRYFSHKSYKTSRVFQFILAYLAQTSGQQGVIWWANHHRLHHKHSDTAKDPHSPLHMGFWKAHVGWIFERTNYNKDINQYTMVSDWLKYPELVWLGKLHYVPTVSLGILAWLLGGWPGLIVGFCMSTIAVYHSTFFINSLTHIFGKQRYLTADGSRNNWWLALLTFGEGWHNNHHYCQFSARMGFKWYEIDITYYSLKLLEKLGIVWDLRVPPPSVIKGTHKIPQKYINQSKEMLGNAGLDLEVLSSRLTRMSSTVGHLFGQPKYYIDNVSRGLKTSLRQVQLSIQEKTHDIDPKLPQILAKVVKEKFQQVTTAIDQVISALNSRMRLKEAANTLAIASLSLGADNLIANLQSTTTNSK